MPRAWPSFSVARASLLTKVSSMAASCGRKLAMTRDKALVELAQAIGESVLGVGGDEAAGDVDEPRAPIRSTIPQPVRRRPGSMPRMRIACADAALMVIAGLPPISIVRLQPFGLGWPGQARP